MGKDEAMEECKRLWKEFIGSLNDEGVLSSLRTDAHGQNSVCNSLTINAEDQERSMWPTYKKDLMAAKKIIADWKKKSKRVDTAESETSKLKTDLSSAQQSGESCSNLLLVWKQSKK